MKKLLFFLMLSISVIARPSTPDEALDSLIEGNIRFAKGKPEQADRSPKRREAKATFQRPYAVIVACSDSRMAPEILFDAGIGELFVVRLAGNVVDQMAIESILYAVEHLGALTILVVGHESCGAVDAVVQGKIGDIEALAKEIEPAVKQARKSGKTPLLEEAIRLNALETRKTLLENDLIKELAEKKKLSLNAGYYDFMTGKVELLRSSP